MVAPPLSLQSEFVFFYACAALITKPVRRRTRLDTLQLKGPARFHILTGKSGDMSKQHQGKLGRRSNVGPIAWGFQCRVLQGGGAS